MTTVWIDFAHADYRSGILTAPKNIEFIDSILICCASQLSSLFKYFVFSQFASREPVMKLVLYFSTKSINCRRLLFLTLDWSSNTLELPEQRNQRLSTPWLKLVLFSHLPMLQDLHDPWLEHWPFCSPLSIHIAPAFVRMDSSSTDWARYTPRNFIRSFTMWLHELLNDGDFCRLERSCVLARQRIDYGLWWSLLAW
jgi:hypothetical protein